MTIDERMIYLKPAHHTCVGYVKVPAFKFTGHFSVVLTFNPLCHSLFSPSVHIVGMMSESSFSLQLILAHVSCRVGVLLMNDVSRVAQVLTGKWLLKIYRLEGEENATTWVLVALGAN